MTSLGQRRAREASARYWTKDLPSHWDVAKLKRVAAISASNVDKNKSDEEIPVRLCNYTDVYYNEYITSDLEFMEATATLREITRFRLRGGEVLLTKDSETAQDIAIPAYVAENLDGTLCGYHLYFLRPRTHLVDGRFLFRACSVSPVRDQFVVEANGITRYGLSQGDLGSAEVPVPSLDEQRAIADFLDRETAKIDALIDSKQRLIELLEEKRRSRIAEIVEGQPGYHRAKLAYFVDILPGYAFPSSGFTRSEEDIRLLRGTNVGVGRIDWTDMARWPANDAPRFSRYQLAEGDIVLGMDRPWISRGIRVARIEERDLPALLLQRVARLRAHRFLSQDYLELVLASPQFHAYFAPILTGVSVPHISPTQIGEFSFPLPPKERQGEIVKTFQTENRRIRSLRHKLEHSLELFREQRTSLISAVVTGNVDVWETTA